MTPEEKMAELGLELRPVPVASSGLLPWVQVGNLLYMSGRTPDRTDKRWDGQVGKEYTVAEGQGRRARGRLEPALRR